MKITDDFVFFSGEKDVLSNYCYTPFHHYGLVFRSAEQAIMYQKARMFEAHRIAALITKSTSVRACIQLGHSKEIEVDEEVWKKEEMNVYKRVLNDKYANLELREALLATGKRKLVYASSQDTILGVGLEENDPDILDPSKWRGENKLGELLMEIRTYISRNLPPRRIFA